MGTNILAINRYDWCSYYLSAKYPMFSMAIFTFCDFFFNLSLDERGHVEKKFPNYKKFLILSILRIIHPYKNLEKRQSLPFFYIIKLASTYIEIL